MIWIGVTSTSMPQLTGWQAQFAVTLQHYGKVLTNAFSWLPNWAGLVLFLAFLALLAWVAYRQVVGQRAQMPQAVGDQEIPDEDQMGKEGAEQEEEAVER
jgi:type II secretory pathway component PulF